MNTSLVRFWFSGCEKYGTSSEVILHVAFFLIIRSCPGICKGLSGGYEDYISGPLISVAVVSLAWASGTGVMVS